MADAQHRIVIDRRPHADGRQVHRYEILKEIGSGGMATVYLARQLGTQRLVAVKFPHSDKLTHEQIYERFVREVEMLNAVRHENVIGILDFGLDENYYPFMVMEYLDGYVTLLDVIQSARDAFEAQSPVPAKITKSLVTFAVVVQIFRQLLAGLDAIHKAGIIHRDLKPENILVRIREGVAHVIIMDFGVAKNLNPKEGQANLTRGMVVGTALYLSPEHMMAAKHPETGVEWTVGPYSDFWSACIILYEMVSGRVPFQDDRSFELLARRIMQDAPEAITNFVSDVNPGLHQLFWEGLSKFPWKRPQSVKEMFVLVDVIDTCERTANLSAQPVDHLIPRSTMASETGITSIHPPRRGVVVLVSLFLLGLAFAGAGIFLARPPSLPDPGEPPVVLAPPLANGGVTPPQPAAPKVHPSVVTPSVPPLTRGGMASPAPPVRPAGPTLRTPGPGPGTTRQDAPFLSAYEHGLRAAERGNCGVAGPDMSLVLVRFPDFPKPLRILGDCARKRGDTAKARRLYEQYLGFEGVEPLPPEAASLLK